MNYDPSLVLCGNLAKQTVRLTFGMWEYRKTIDVIVGGNCTGLTVIESAISNAFDDLIGDAAFAEITLEHPEQGDLQCQDDEDNGEEWLKDMLVSAEIMSIVPDDRFKEKAE